MANEKEFVIRFKINPDGSAEFIDKFKEKLDKSTSSTQSLRAQLKQMQQELQKLDVGSEEFQKLSLEAGKLKDQINDAAEAVRANAGNAFEGLSNNAGLLKDRIMNLDLEGVGQSFKGIAGNIKGITFKEMQNGISAVGSGLKALGKALLTNPIFLIGAAIGAAIAYSDELLSLVDGLTEEDEKQLNIQKGKAALALEQLDAISNQEEILKEQGMTEEEIRDLKQERLMLAIEEQKVTVATQKAQLQGQIDAAQRNKDILAGTLQFLTAPSRLLLEIVNKLLDAANYVGIISDETRQSIGDTTALLDQGIDKIATSLFDPVQVKADGEAAIKESEATLLKLENQAAGFRNKDREEAKKKSDEKKKQAEFEAKFIAELYAEQDAEIEANNKALADRLAAIWQRANELSRAAQQTQADEIKSIQDELDVYLDEKGKSAQELELQRLQDAYFEKKTLLENAGQDTTAITEKYEAEQNAIKEKYAKEEDARQKESNRKKVQLAADAFGALAALDGAFSANNKKGARAAFNRNKAYGIAQAGIQTGLAVTAALTAGGNAIKLATGAQFIEAGIAAATGIAQIAKIASTKFSDSGGDAPSGGGNVPSGGGGGGNQGTVPTFNALNLDFLKNRPEQTPKAYVLAQDVSSAVEARDKVRDLARIN